MEKSLIFLKLIANSKYNMRYLIKYSFSLILAFLISAPALQSQTLNKIKVEVADPASLLWKIEGKGLTKPSYLFGTIHLIPRSKFLFNSAMNNAFSQVDNVAFEIDMNIMNDYSQMFEILSKVRMPDGITIKDLLTPEDYKLFQEKFSDQGLPTVFLEGIKPMFLSAMGGDMGGANGDMVSYEVELSEKAKEQNKMISGLETIDEQLSIIDSIPLKDQAAMLVESLKSTDADSGYDEMVEKYLQQDIEGLNDVINESPEAKDIELMNSLLKDRNIKWISIMKKMMETSPTFFAVGAGHLGGNDGVIKLLRKEGYTLSPVIEL